MNELLFDEIVADAHARPLPALTSRRVKLPWLPRKVDAIVGPTSPSVAWPLGAKFDDPLQMYLADVYTLPASLAGLPGISVPAAPSPSGLPIGLQIVTPAWTESRMFSLAHAFEQVSPARGKRP